MFLAYPTYMELDNLVSGLMGTYAAAANTNELTNIAVRASQWASDVCNVPLHAHTRQENARLRASRDGTLSFHPADNPVKTVTAVSYGYTGSANLMAITDLSTLWIEEGAQVLLGFAPMSTKYNSIQFGPPSTSSELYTSWTYTAGYCNTLLASATTAGATSITVADPTGLVAGDVLRVWDPIDTAGIGGEEACQIAGTYVTGSTTVPLVSALTYAHHAASLVSEMPSDIQTAVVFYMCAMLSRPDSVAEDSFPDLRSGISTRAQDTRQLATGLIAEAYRNLRTYTRTR